LPLSSFPQRISQAIPLTFASQSEFDHETVSLKSLLGMGILSRFLRGKAS